MLHVFFVVYLIICLDIPVLVAHSDRGEGDRVLVVDRGGDVHRPGKELLGQAHLK